MYLTNHIFPILQGGVSMLPKALSCSHVYWGRVEGVAYFMLMLSVRILGDGGWQLLKVGPWLPSSPPPPHLRSLLGVYLCTGYCALYIDWAYVSLRDCVTGFCSFAVFICLRFCYKFHAIARKRDHRKYTNRQYKNLGHTIFMTHPTYSKSSDSKN